MYSEPSDPFIFLGIVATCAAIVRLANWLESRKVRQLRVVHKRHTTHYQRLMARLAVSSGAVTSGYRR